MAVAVVSDPPAVVVSESPATVTSDPRKSWKRFTLSILGIAIVVADWRWATGHLYTLPEHSIAAFTSMTNNQFYVIGSITIFMVTGVLVYDWKNATSTVTQIVSAFADGKKDPKDFDDKSIS